MAPQPPPDPTTQGQPPWWQVAAQGAAGAGQGSQQGPQWNKTTPYQQGGTAIGKALGSILNPKPAYPLSSPMGPQMPASGFGVDPAASATGESGPGMGLDATGMSGDFGSMAFADHGAVVTKPTLMMLGEHEPEAVVPLSHKPGAKVRPSVATGRNYYGE